MAISKLAASVLNASAPILAATPFKVCATRFAVAVSLAVSALRQVAGISACCVQNLRKLPSYSVTLPIMRVNAGAALIPAMLKSVASVGDGDFLALLLGLLGDAGCRTGIHLSKVAHSKSGSIGLGIKSFIPASIQRCLSAASALAVMATTGRLAKRG